MADQPKAATVLPAHTPALFNSAVNSAVELLRRGEVVALPTETVYGLAANALDATAVRRIFEAKERPEHNPIIVHVSDLAMAKTCAASWPELASRLAAAFWPGPLTIVLPKSDVIPNVVTAGGETVGLRMPSHPLFQAVIRACGFPLAAPSANRANELSPTNASHVARSLGARIPLIVDGGQSQVGIESTVLDVTVWPPRLLRPGMIHDESILAVTGRLEAGVRASSGALRSPGMLKKHYAPKAKLVVLSWSDDRDLDLQMERIGLGNRNLWIIAHSHVPNNRDARRVSVIPHDPEAFARAIYSELHRCDREGADLIVVETLPDAPEWRGIADRLSRAAS